MFPASWKGCLSYRMSSSQSRQFHITKEVGTRRRARIPILAVPERLRGLSSVILCSLLDFMDCYHSPIEESALLVKKLQRKQIDSFVTNMLDYSRTYVIVQYLYFQTKNIQYVNCL
ncbi:hypothetical protein TNIN_400411 [Trichonephila inaurata madagascariensis]|uniref:Uncharacterized protein n=1 Tax=Trichonephila inaurata madagascariensis TaxID=2747483 RepID=A0A8X7CMJ7_9ARAC|nr:hypothetical protein TNIN_400411 [Trichonephila inaurata madagascariensis]